MLSQFYWAGQPTDFYVRVVFREKSGKKYMLPSTTFVAFWELAVYRMCNDIFSSYFWNEE
jgi:hypothetical protein